MFSVESLRFEYKHADRKVEVNKLTDSSKKVKIILQGTIDFPHFGKLYNFILLLQKDSIFVI